MMHAPKSTGARPVFLHIFDTVRDAWSMQARPMRSSFPGLGTTEDKEGPLPVPVVRNEGPQEQRMLEEEPLQEEALDMDLLEKLQACFRELPEDTTLKKGWLRSGLLLGFDF